MRKKNQCGTCGNRDWKKKCERNFICEKCRQQSDAHENNVKKKEEELA